MLLRDARARRLLSGLGVSSLGDGMSTVTIAWLAVRTAPTGQLGLFVGLAIAAYTLPGAIGALALGRYLSRRPARALVLAHCLLRTGFLGAIVALEAAGALSPAAYVALLAGSSLLASWGTAGEYTMLAELGGAEGRLAANSLASAQVWLATILGPAMAGLLLTQIAPGWLLAFDAASFAFLGVQAWRTHSASPTTDQPVDAEAAESGFRLLRRNDLLGLIALTWLFFFLYGPGRGRASGLRRPRSACTRPAARRLLDELRRRRACVDSPRRHAPQPRDPSDRSADRRRLGRMPRPVRVRATGDHARVLRRGGIVYGPFTPLTYALFQSITTTANLPSVLAARSAALIIAAPLGTAIGGPIIAVLGAKWTLTASGLATLALAAIATPIWTRAPHRRTA